MEDPELDISDMIQEMIDTIKHEYKHQEPADILVALLLYLPEVFIRVDPAVRGMFVEAVSHLHQVIGPICINEVLRNFVKSAKSGKEEVDPD